MNEYLGYPISVVDTPSLIVDLDILEENILRMANLTRSSNINLRPHVKTHKIPDIALMQIENGAIGITTAKLSEAEVFINSGIKDIFVAYPIVGDIKANRAAKLSKKSRLIVGVDSLTGIEDLEKAAKKCNTKIEVRVEIDIGKKRSGVTLDALEHIIQRITNSSSLILDGIFAYRGALFGGARTAKLNYVGKEEAEMLVNIANELRDKGHDIKEVSLGSSPTSKYAAKVQGVTEIRPGTYVFNDMMQKKLGVIGLESIALSILTTVVSKPADKLITVDGGTKTFQGDLPPDKNDIGLKGYATIKANNHDFLDRMSEEHGVVTIENSKDYFIGQKIQLIPNHVCPTVNLSDYIVGSRKDIVEKVWEVEARGKTK